MVKMGPLLWMRIAKRGSFSKARLASAASSILGGGGSGVSSSSSRSLPPPLSSSAGGGGGGGRSGEGVRRQTGLQILHCSIH